MSSPLKNETRYNELNNGDDIVDLGHESDTTACSDAFLKQAAGPARRVRQSSRGRKTPNMMAWMRWGSIIMLQTGILMMLALVYKMLQLNGRSWDVETGSDINGIFKTESHQLIHLTPQQDKYMPNMTSDIDRMAIRQNWNDLMPLGSGSVEIRNYKDYPLLGQPIDDDPDRTGSIYEAAWTHALHCLYYHVDTYHQMVVHGSNNVELNPKHASHCFEYLRSSIICNMDMTLEGSTSVVGSAGMGQPHVCRNRDEAMAWIEARRVDDIKDVVGN